MASRRTISYIGLWALIMPWLGFSWGTKTVLFSLTGILLLVIGNRHYHSGKSKTLNEKVEELPEVKKEYIAEPTQPVMPVYKDVPEYMNPATSVSNSNTTNYVNDNFSNSHVETKEENHYVESHPEPKVFSYNQVSVNSEVEEKSKIKPRKKIEIVTRKRSSNSRPISLDSLNTENTNE